ncbi:MAG: hypothetical protein HKN12_01825, partial [Gemmatimonadetes bacterium]|nr:hypothetical protein [Gemmatimonadota bacterium]
MQKLPLPSAAPGVRAVTVGLALAGLALAGAARAQESAESAPPVDPA